MVQVMAVPRAVHCPEEIRGNGACRLVAEPIATNTNILCGRVEGKRLGGSETPHVYTLANSFFDTPTDEAVR